MSIFAFISRIAMALGLTTLYCAAAMSARELPVYLPMTFHTETQAIRTSACVQVRERIYPPQPTPWGGFSGDTDPAERAFAAVMGAIKRKDREALLQASDPTEGREPKTFDKQAAAFFKQFETIQLVAVPRAYEFDGLVVFFTRLWLNAQTIFAPFVFVRESDGSFGFLPARTEQLTYLLVSDWFLASWGPAATGQPAYCPAEEVKRATHRVALDSSAGSQARQDPSYLLLRGASLDSPGALNAIG